MEGEIARKALRIRGPTRTLTFARSVTATSASIDLTAYVGRWVTMTSETNPTYILLAGNATNAEALDNTATSGNNQTGVVPTAGGVEFEVDIGNPFLGFKTASGSTATLRLWVSSERIG